MRSAANKTRRSGLVYAFCVVILCFVMDYHQSPILWPSGQVQSIAFAKTQHRAHVCSKKRGQSTMDLYGDALPACAVARLGSIRFRHKGGVWSLDVSRDGRLLATASRTEVRLWEMKTGRLQRRFVERGARVHALAISPNKRWLAIAFRKGEKPSIHLYRLPSGRRYGSLKSPWAVATSMAFSPDSKRLITNVPHVRIWSIPSGKCLHEFKQISSIAAMALSPDGKRIAVTTRRSMVHRYIKPGKELDRLGHKHLHKKGMHTTSFLAAQVHLWERKGSRYLHRQLPTVMEGIQALGFSADSKSLWLSGSGGFWRLELSTNKVLVRSKWADSGTIALSQDGQYAAVSRTDPAAQERGLSVYAMAGGRRIAYFALWGSEHLMRMVFVKGNQMLISFERGGQLRFWHLPPGKPKSLRRGHSAAITSIAFSPYGKYLLTASVDQTIRKWDANNGRELRRITLKDTHLRKAGFRADGSIWIVAHNGDALTAWHATTSMQRIFHQKLSASLLEVSHDGQWAAFGEYGKGVFLQHLLLKKRRHLRPAFSHEVFGLQFSRGGQLIAHSFHTKGSMWTWQLPAVSVGEPSMLLNRRYDRFSISPQGNHFVLAKGKDQTEIYVYHSLTRRCLFSARSPQAFSLAIAPNGYRFATGHEGKILLWDIRKKNPLLAFQGRDIDPTHLVFSPDGRRLASVNRDAVVLLWKLPP